MQFLEMLEPMYVVGSNNFILCNLHGQGKGVLVWWMVKGRLLNFFTCALLHNSGRRSMALNTHVVQTNGIIMWKNTFCPQLTWWLWVCVCVKSSDYRNKQKTLVCLVHGGVVCVLSGCVLTSVKECVVFLGPLNIELQKFMLPRKRGFK